MEKSALDRRLAREIAARKAAEQILESKSLELFEANQKLQHLNTSLESQVEQRSQELVESEKRYQVLVESAHDLIYVTNSEGLITYVNKVFELQFGFKTEQVINTHFSEYIQKSEKDKIIAYYQEQVKNKVESSYFEVPSFKKTGETVWIGQNVQFSYHRDGSFKEAIVIGRDITQKKQEEEELISTQLQLLSLIENMHEGVLFVSNKQKIILINPYFCNFFGINNHPSALKGKSLDVIRNNVLAHFDNPETELKHILENSFNKQIGSELKLKDQRFINYDYVPIISNGKFLGTLWQFTEVTEQKVLDLQIRNSEEKYRGIIENMELGLMEVDNEGRITKVYNWFCKMTGYEPEELVGKNAEDLLLPEEYKSIVDENHRLRKKGEQSVYEIEIFKKNKERIWVIVSGAPFFDLDGNVDGSIGIHFDITNQKQLQNELLAAKEIAEKAQIAEQKFLANMSHEIRTPLNAVIGMSHLLNDTPLSQDQKEYVDMMQYSANLLRNLVTDVLDFAKIESGELEVNNKPFDLIGLLKTLHKTYELKLMGKPVSIHVSLPETKHLVIGDETLINQVLYNLLGNAEKFTPSGEIRLAASLCTSQKGLEAFFTVEDTGIGIEQDKIEDIFKEFKQESRETGVKYGGTGLGLSITKKILNTLGGAIQVESEKGKGTTFSVMIPVQLSGKTSNTEIGIKTKVTSTASVLVFEDNVVNQNYIKKILENERLEFDIAGNGKEGFEWAKKNKYDLIFMDISMPVMDGYEATISIRNHSGPNQKTPIVALTASAMLNKKDKAFLIGMNDYMTKPFTPRELQAMLAKYLPIDQQENQNNKEDIHSSENTVLDQDTLRMFYDGDDNYALEMFELFLEQYNEQINMLSQLIEDNSFEEAQTLVHKMKPTFSMVGAPAIQESFQLLEDKLRYKDALGVDSAWKESITLLSQYLPAIKKELERLQN